MRIDYQSQLPERVEGAGFYIKESEIEEKVKWLGGRESQRSRPRLVLNH
jgi:hypothetical protein